MTNKHGDYIWYELMTPDAGASADFYSAILGWQIREDPEYREIEASEGFVGGMLQLTPEMIAGGAQPAWVGYIMVDDVDASIAAIEAAGGRTCMPARDMPGVGRFAMMFDPQGGIFYVMKPIPPADKPDGSSNAFAADRPMLGHCAWNELATSDKDAALAFYAKVFSWVKDGEMDMGPMGKYDFLRNGVQFGAVFNRPPEMPVTAWSYYFRVANINSAAETVKSRGGQVVYGPAEVPGDDWCVNAIDPHGAFFALVGKNN